MPVVPDLTPKMSRALADACGFGLYHEFANTSTVRALQSRGLIRSGRRIGWYEATDKGRARQADQALAEKEVGGA